MRSLPIPTTPDCFTGIANQRPNGPWFNGDMAEERSCRRQSREFLIANQHNNCGWCEQKITIHSSHIDHILPQATHAHLTFTPSNLLACCGTTTRPTCGHFKLDSILANWVNPYHTPDLEDFFTYEIDGAMKPSPQLQPQQQAEALAAINHILNLNESVLKGQREQLISDLAEPQYGGMTIDQIYLAIGEFKSVIKQHAPALQAPS